MNTLFKKTPIWQLLMIYLLANVLNVLAVIPLKLNFGLVQAVSDELMRVIMFIVVLLWFSFLMIRNKTSISSELKNFKKDFNPKEGITVLVFNYAISLVIVFILIIILSTIAGFIGDCDVPKSQNDVNISYAAAVINFIAASFIVPVAEEFMFRGVLFNRMSENLGIVKAAIFSSLLFGITHSPISIIGATMFGICMCSIYLRTNNIAVPIVIHMIHNFILCIIESKGILWGSATSIGLSNMDISVELAVGGIFIFGIVSLICGIYLSKKYSFWSFE